MWAGLLMGMIGGVLACAVAARVVYRRQLHRVRLAERRARQAERLAEIGAMTGGLAHEIKNPLSTIGLNAQLLAEAVEDSDLPADGKRRMLNRVGALRRETERLRGILQDFLEFAGQIRVDGRPVDVNAIVGELGDFFHPEAERHGVRLTVQLGAGPDGGSVRAVADVRLLKQALLNLMLNAVQAMSAGGTVAAGGAGGAGGGSAGADSGDAGVAMGGGAGATPGPRGELIIRTEMGLDDAQQQVARVHVIDTGPGIPPEVLARIFQPYFTTKSGGSGLGLPTARRIIEEHGGRLEVHSEVGRGSNFVVVLPTAGRPEAAAG
jgi:signal transduction histidine kinase